MLKSTLSKKVFLITLLGVLTLSFLYMGTGLYADSADLSDCKNNYMMDINSHQLLNFAKAESSSILSDDDDSEDENNGTSNNANKDSSDDETDTPDKSSRAIISITSDKSEYKVGDTATFYIRIQNTGELDLANIAVMFLLPKGLSFVSTYTGTSSNNYNSASGVWYVGNLRLTAEGAGLGPGIKQLTVTTVVTPDMAGKSFNLETFFTSITDDYGNNILDKVSSSSSSFSVDSYDGYEAGNSNIKDNSSINGLNSTSDGNEAGNSNIKDNSTTNGLNSTSDGDDKVESKNHFDNNISGSGLLGESKNPSDNSITLNDIKNNFTAFGFEDINSLDSSNPSSEDPMYEIKNISGSGSNSESPQNPILIAITLLLVGIIGIGYFYGIKR
ncbi:MAG: DUF11 domain-containing protein [Methanobrevibacter sp.]|nr:DUF11 domain-containing protein [Methanobrevibacter sp.]